MVYILLSLHLLTFLFVSIYYQYISHACQTHPLAENILPIIIFHSSSWRLSLSSLSPPRWCTSSQCLSLRTMALKLHRRISKIATPHLATHSLNAPSAGTRSTRTMAMLAAKMDIVTTTVTCRARIMENGVGGFGRILGNGSRVSRTRIAPLHGSSHILRDQLVRVSATVNRRGPWCLLS